jgi:hypothetical protein
MSSALTRRQVPKHTSRMEPIMNITKTMSRRPAAGCLAAAAVADIAAAATPASGATSPAPDSACSFDSAYLPRTADAVAGWYAQCQAQQVVATSGLPNTADAIEAWGGTAPLA